MTVTELHRGIKANVIKQELSHGTRVKSQKNR